MQKESAAKTARLLLIFFALAEAALLITLILTTGD